MGARAAVVLAGTTTIGAVVNTNHGRPTWHARAACRGVGTDIFFPTRDAPSQAWRAYCARCPVADQCLEQALDDPHTAGNWAGTTERQRNALRRHQGAA